MKWLSWNTLFKVVATVVGIAGTIVAAPTAVVPTVLIGIATKVVTYGAVIGLVAAKVLPGNGTNAPNTVQPAPKP